MYRLFDIRIIRVFKVTVVFNDWKPVNHFSQKQKNFSVYKKCWYSTVPNHKIISETSNPKKKIKVKLKAKPYEELLKVLGMRIDNLEHQNKLSSSDHLKENSETSSQASENKSYAELSNSEEGMFTIKSSKKSKKSTAAVKIAKSVPVVKKTAELPSQKNNSKLSEKQAALKNVVHSSYAMRALKSYVEVSINAGEVEKAHEYLKKQFEYIKRKYDVKLAKDIDLCNLMIRGWAQKGRLDRIKQEFSSMFSLDITPNLQSYAGYLECIARSKFIDTREVQHILDDMRLKGLSYQDLFHKCQLRGDQRERIIEALEYVVDDISSSALLSDDVYSCKLLEKLNDKSYMKGNIHPSFGFTEADIESIASTQFQIEDRYSLQIKSVDTVDQPSNKTLKSRKYLEECEEDWRKKLTLAIKNFKNFEKRFYGRGTPREESIYPYIAVIDTDIIVHLLLQEIRLLSETGEFFSPSEKFLYKGLGVKIMNHYFIWLNKKTKITEKVGFIYHKYLSYLLNPKLLDQYTPREYWEHLKITYPHGPTIDYANTPWTHGILVKIGFELYDILQKNVAFNANSVCHKSPSKVMTQAFYVTYEDGEDVKISKHIRTHHLLCKLYRDAKLEHLEFDTTLIPMLSPPKPWVNIESGGLLIAPVPFIRLNDHAISQNAQYSKIPSKELYPCFDSLNSLSLCPWIINEPVLEIVTEVFQKGGNEELDIPLNPNSFPPAPKVIASMSKKEKSKVWRQKKELKKKKCEASSLWFDCLYKLSIANHFREKVFWFPHNLDFRGRTYPTPPHFNHLGSDMARSILLFAEGKRLGKNGLDWLKIHLINLTGFKKRDSHRERLNFANEMIPEILDSADKPFEGNQWWRTSDKPWQTLACCKELADALRSPNPEEYISHFPIHQDGSCNGLQHYAALGRDAPGAIEVNLHPSDAPCDVYSGVSAIVERERQKDALDGLEIAKALEGFVRRKVVKQTVMTFVYGVTKYGAKLQILKQLKDIPDYPERYYHEGSAYLMQKIFLSIKEMFTATQEIQDWLTECAEQITRVSGATLEWITPLGLPVIQPYHKETLIRSPKYTLPQGRTESIVYHSYYEPYQSPNVRKQKNGFAPNFIHSLDASHMMLTSLFCQRKGITFVSVHDCYWTHASNIEIMNKICREQFVSLHKEPILEDLSAFFLDKYATVVNENVQKNKMNKNSAHVKLRDVLSSVPQKGKFDLDKVLESEYFFS